jgi:hypothetical protein
MPELAGGGPRHHGNGISGKPIVLRIGPRDDNRTTMAEQTHADTTSDVLARGPEVGMAARQ